MFLNQDVSAIVDFIKEIGLRIRFRFLSDEDKFKHNLGLLKGKHWFQEMLLNNASLEQLIVENDLNCSGNHFIYPGGVFMIRATIM